MKEKELISFLQQNGWSCQKDEVGDYFCLMEIGSKVVKIIPSIQERRDHVRFSFMPSITTREFSSGVSFILGEGNFSSPIIVKNEAPEKLASLSEEDAMRIAEETLRWAAQQDVEEGLAEYRRAPTDSKGAMPVRHLCALALNSETDKLDSYRLSFDSGDRLGFVPYINLDMIRRAIELAGKMSASRCS